MNPFDRPKFELDLRRHALLPALLETLSFRGRPDELLRHLVRSLQTLLPFDFISVLQFDSVRRVVKVFLGDGEEWPRSSAETPISQNISETVWRTQTPLLIDDLLRDDLATENCFEPELRWLRERDVRSYYALPLTNRQQKLGAIGFASRRNSTFDPSDLQFLEHVAAIVTLGLDSAFTESAFAEEKARLRLLFEISSPRLLTYNLPQSVASILGSLQKWAPHDDFGLYLYDEDAQSLRLHMADPTFVERMAPLGLTPLDESLAGQAFRGRNSLVLDHSALSSMPFDSVKRGMELGVRCLCLTPIFSERGSLGVLKVARKHDNPFLASDVELLESVAAKVGLVLKQDKKVEAPLPGTVAAGSLLDLAKSLASGNPVTRAGRLQSPTVLAASESLNLSQLSWFGTAATLLESEQLLTAYFKASKVGLCILDSGFRYLALNDTLAEMNGVPAPAHLGKSVREVLGEFAEVVEVHFAKILSTGQPILNLEISSTLPTRNEPGHWIEYYIPIKDAVGQVAQIGIITVEVTEQKRLEESLRGLSETLRQERKQQQVLTEVNRLLATDQDIGKIFPHISACLRRILRQEYASLSLRDEKSGTLVRQALDFPLRKAPGPDGEVNLVVHRGRKALRESAPLILSRDDMRDFPSPISDHFIAEGLKSLCYVPLMRPSGSLGTLVLGSTRVEAFKTDDLTLLNQVAYHLAIALENAASSRELAELKTRLGREKRYLQGDAPTNIHFEGIIGESAALRKVLDQIAVVAPSNASVLLLGETGTGKGLIAKALHHTSLRKHNAFITLNCAAIPTGLLESELFGHEKGAFTGAVNQKVGRLELADKGTLFLDEIGEISPELQPKLLRVLQDHEFERLGGVKTIRVDVRLVAATNRDLARSVVAKEFRSDLFYRLNVFPIRLPSLRERREDIPLLVRHFVKKYAARMSRVIETIPSDAMDAMMNWEWPGNLRELENLIERSVILSAGTALSVPLDELSSGRPVASRRSLEDAEREHILEVLRETRGVLWGPAGAAARLGMKRTTLQSKMKRLGITRRDYSDHGAA